MTRKEIDEREARERKDTYKEMRDIKKNERDLTVEDKESVSELASELEFPGFSEAGEQIRHTVTSAGEATDDQFEEQNEDAIENVFTPQKEHEQELEERSDGMAKDIDRINRRKLNTDTAQRELENSKVAAEQGKEAIDRLRDEQENERSEGEKDRDEQQTHLKGVKVEFTE